MNPSYPQEIVGDHPGDHCYPQVVGPLADAPPLTWGDHPRDQPGPPPGSIGCPPPPIRGDHPDPPDLTRRCPNCGAGPGQPCTTVTGTTMTTLVHPSRNPRPQPPRPNPSARP